MQEHCTKHIYIVGSSYMKVINNFHLFKIPVLIITFVERMNSVEKRAFLMFVSRKE